MMAFWSRPEKKFYRLNEEDPILRDSLATREFHTQLAAAISQGILWEHSSIAEDLTEFINVLLCSAFDLCHVDFELRRKNAKLFEEDEAFLSQLQI